jgi:L-amino acid N-acyltransferase YncA
MVTFMDKIRRCETTLVVIKDEQGHKFGAMCFEDWMPRKGFYGTGESFVYTFKDTDEV